MNYFDRILLEENFRYIGLTQEEGDYYLNLLRHTKEITDTEYSFGGSKFDIICAVLNKKDNKVYFNGAITNGNEDKAISGVIYESLNKTYVYSDIERLGIRDNKRYSINEEFKKTGDMYRRESRYNISDTYYDAYLEFEPIEQYLLSKVKKEKGN